MDPAHPKLRGGIERILCCPDRALFETEAVGFELCHKYRRPAKDARGLVWGTSVEVWTIAPVIEMESLHSLLRAMAPKTTGVGKQTMKASIRSRSLKAPSRLVGSEHHTTIVRYHKPLKEPLALAAEP